MAKVVSPSQSISASGGINTSKNALNSPKSGWNMNLHDTPIRAGLIAKGRISRVLTVRRNFPPGARRSANPRASPTEAKTDATVKMEVTRIEFQSRSSSRA